MSISRRLAVGFLGVTAGIAAKPAVRSRFVGVWHLVSCERKFKDGRVVFPYGEKPVGRIAYDKAGRMSALLMRPGRSASADDGFMAYYGTFDIDVARETVIHHVQAGFIPSWVGTNLERTYRFEANRLVLTAASKDSATVLTWEREAD